jgi:hypothetical protein
MIITPASSSRLVVGSGTTNWKLDRYWFTPPLEKPPPVLAVNPTIAVGPPTIVSSEPSR